MALDYRKCAQEIVDHIGGRENVAQAAHCATRLRLVIKDNSKVDKNYLDNVEGVKGMFESNGQLQLIIGTGTVNKVYEEFLNITGMTAATKDDVKAAAAAQQPLWRPSRRFRDSALRVPTGLPSSTWSRIRPLPICRLLLQSRRRVCSAGTSSSAQSWVS